MSRGFQSYRKTDLRRALIAARDYLRAFDLTAIAVTRDRRLIVTRNPAGRAAAWNT